MVTSLNHWPASHGFIVFVTIVVDHFELRIVEKDSTESSGLQVAVL